MRNFKIIFFNFQGKERIEINDLKCSCFIEFIKQVVEEIKCEAYQAFYLFFATSLIIKGAQWLSGRVLDSRLRGRGFEPHRSHCVVVLEQDTFT